MKEEELYGDRHDDHDWDKISNIDVCEPLEILLPTHTTYIFLVNRMLFMHELVEFTLIFTVFYCIRLQFEGYREADDLKRFWQNYLHPSINKSTWKEDEIKKLGEVAEQFNCCHWDKIAEALGVGLIYCYICVRLKIL